MKKIFRCFISLIRMLYIQIRYLSKASVKLIQLFEHINISIINNGYITIGIKNQNRGNLYLCCDGGNLSIGSHCFFNTNASVTCLNSIKIGNRCSFGNNVVIVDHDHNIKNDEGGFIKGKVIIGDNVWIGANVIILKDTIIGNNSVIGAGAVVKGYIPSDTLFIQKRSNTLIDRKKEKIYA